MLITLDPIEVERATLNAVRLTCRAIRKGYKDTGTPTDDMTRFEQHFRAAKAELAVAQFTGLEWLAEHYDWAHDVGHLEVRSIEWDSTIQLRASWKDERHGPSQQFVLARVDGQYVEIIGWSTYAKIRSLGKRKMWADKPHYYLDREYLFSPELLIR